MTDAPTMTTTEAAACLRIKPRTLRKWRVAYGLPYTKVGTTKGDRVLFDRDKLAVWLERFRAVK